jgi:CPA1 family monovalent cation:H+ antiporter
LGGGLLVGGTSGWIVFQLMCRVDEYPLEIMMSLALAAGAYAAADAIGASGPIAAVVAGLLIGSRGTRYAMSETTRQNLSLFWSVIDELLNALLFLLLGFEVLGLAFSTAAVVAAACAILLSLPVRAGSIMLTTYWLHARNPERWRGLAVLTWGGLRGGISVALALGLPPSPWRNSILLVCYAIVVFSVLVQGTTMRRVIGGLYASAGSAGQ